MTSRPHGNPNFYGFSIINDRLKAQPVKPVHIQYELQCKKLITIIKQKSKKKN